VPFANDSVDKVDVLFGIDNSGSMEENQAQLAREFRVLIDQLVNPPVNPVTGRPRWPAVRSLHVGVVSSDLGAAGSSGIPSCLTEGGDQGLLNPIRNGQAMRLHQPWTSPAAARVRPRGCTQNPNQYPTFLTFDAARDNASTFRDDFVCNAFLGVAGCGLEQQLESVYRALITQDARARAGNTLPNAGFVRDDAVLAIVLVTDEEDGSVRDCRFPERDPRTGRPLPCDDATDVYNSASTRWGHDNLNVRMYNYRPGSPQDPTWRLDRYMDPSNPNRGFPSLKPGHPERVIFAALAGVPLQLPSRDGNTDWDALLGRNPDGSDAFVGPSREGPVSFRPANIDPACAGERDVRVMPACRREGSAPTSSCRAADQYFALPSRRIAEVARRFDVTHHTGSVASICANDYAPALRQIVERIGNSLTVPCLQRPLQTDPPLCDVASVTEGCVTAQERRAVTPRCVLRERLPPTLSAATWCTAAHGRRPVGVEDGREVCQVDPVAAVPGEVPAPGLHGFFYDLRRDPESRCDRRVSFTDGDQTPPGASALLDCVQFTTRPAEGPARVGP
jgi:hypothetical protein